MAFLLFFEIRHHTHFTIVYLLLAELSPTFLASLPSDSTSAAHCAVEPQDTMTRSSHSERCRFTWNATRSSETSCGMRPNAAGPIPSSRLVRCAGSLSPMFLVLCGPYLTASYTRRNVSDAQFKRPPVWPHVVSEVCAEVWRTVRSSHKTARLHDAGLLSRHKFAASQENELQNTIPRQHIWFRRMSRQNCPASVPHILNIKYKFEYKNQTSVHSFINVPVCIIKASQFVCALMYIAVPRLSQYSLGLFHITPPLTKFVPNLHLQH